MGCVTDGGRVATAAHTHLIERQCWTIRHPSLYALFLAFDVSRGGVSQSAMQSNEPLKPMAPAPLAVQLLTNLEKTLRSYRLYEARGPQYEAHMGGLTSAVVEATASGPVVINLSPFGPYLDGATAPTEGDYARQWFDLFEEGARQIVFTSGIEADEIRELMHVLCGEEGDTEDIVTALWRKNLHHINVQVARLLVRSPGGVDEAHTLEEQLGRWRQQLGGASLNEGGVVTDESRTPLQQDDFRLLAQDEKTFDWSRIAQEVPPDVRADARRPRLADEIDRQMSDYERFLDIVDAAEGQSEQLLLHVLSAMTHYGNTTELARFMETLSAHDGIGSRAIQMLLEDDKFVEQLKPIMEASPDVFTGTLATFNREDAEVSDRADTASDPSEALTEIIPIVQEADDIDPLETHKLAVFSSSPRAACESVNALFTIGSDEAVGVALGGYAARSVSVRQLVVIHVLRKSLSHNSETLQEELEKVIRSALKDPDKGIRKLVLEHFLKHSDKPRLEAVMRLLTQTTLTLRALPERLIMLRLVSQYDHEQEVVDYLCELLLKYRLFSSEEELQFQTEVAKYLVRSENPKAAKAIMKVLKRWTVPSQVKAIIQQEVDAFQAEQGDGEVDG